MNSKSRVSSLHCAVPWHEFAELDSRTGIQRTEKRKTRMGDAKGRDMIDLLQNGWRCIGMGIAWRE